MRALAFIPFLIVAGCGEGPAENKAAPERAAAIAPGQWELTAEVTRFEQADEGAPRINTPVGTRTTESVCVPPGDRAPPQLFSGESFDCSYGAYYARDGRQNMTLNCRRDGLDGQIPMTTNGTFTEDGMDYSRVVRTVLVTDGDVIIESRVTGRRTGDCPAEDADGNRAG